MNAVERGHETLVRGHRSRRRALVGSDGLNNALVFAGEQQAEQEVSDAAIQELGGKATRQVIIPPTPTEVPPADFAG